MLSLSGLYISAIFSYTLEELARANNVSRFVFIAATWERLIFRYLQPTSVPFFISLTTIAPYGTAQTPRWRRRKLECEYSYRNVFMSLIKTPSARISPFSL